MVDLGEKSHFFPSDLSLLEINIISYNTKINVFWPKIKNRTKPNPERTLMTNLIQNFKKEF